MRFAIAHHILRIRLTYALPDSFVMTSAHTSRSTHGACQTVQWNFHGNRIA